VARSGKGFVLGTLLAAAVALPALLGPAASLAAGGSLAPADPAFLRYLDDPGAAPLGLVPAPVSFAGVPRVRLAPIAARYPDSYVSPAAASTRAVAEAAPAAFDLRGAGRVGPIRDQGRWGTCWAFAALAALESGQLPAAVNDYSENNLANRSGFSLGYGAGGNSSMAAAYLLRWDGPVAEADDPYSPTASIPGASPAGATVRAHVHEVLALPARRSSSDNADLKWAVMTYGAVYTTMYWTDSAFRDSTDAYCYPGVGANHAVDVVGWDDAYPAAGFATPPAGPGAFLVRNSWGTDFGSAGYFWVSYYDASFGRQSAVFAGAEPAAAGERIYQHDPLGWIASYRHPAATEPTTAWFAAVYTPAEDGTLDAAGFYATAPSATYEVRVADSVAGIQGAAAAAGGTLAAAGYHTVAFVAPVAVSAGRPVVIAVRLTTPGYNYPVAIERPLAGYADATAAAGQSYVSGDGVGWTDLTALLAGADVCLKGYGVAAGSAQDPPAAPATPVAPRVSVRSGSARARSVARIVFRLTHADPTTTADVQLTLRTRRGRVLRRQTLHDVDVTTRHAWRVRTPSKPGACVVRAVASLDTGQVSRPATATLRVR
jgi:C1A family cysteine protease